MRKKEAVKEEDGDLIEDIQEHFPALFKEIMEGEEQLKDEESRTSSGSKKIRKFMGYMPGVVDFICRCKTEKEALEIIDFMLNKGEISREYADSLKNQLKEKGLEFFGEHRTPGYYERA